MEITRRQGRVVIVGYVKLDIHPKNFLYREIDLRYSRAYGPGSYDTSYEKGRVDYPFGYVRWTEKRNLEEFIRLVAAGAVNPEPLIAGVYPVERAQEPFDAIRERTLPGVAALISYGARPGPAAGRCRSTRARSVTERSGSRSSVSATMSWACTSPTSSRCVTSSSAASRRRRDATPPWSPRASVPR